MKEAVLEQVEKWVKDLQAEETVPKDSLLYYAGLSGKYESIITSMLTGSYDYYLNEVKNGRKKS